MEKNNIFNLPANTDYLFNKEKVNSILEKFIDSLKEQVPAIEQVLAKDIINGDIKIKAKELSSFFKKDNSPLLINFSKTSIKDGLGSICAKYNGNPFITIKLIILAIRTHNQIYLLTNNYMNTNEFLVSILDKLLVENGYCKKILKVISLSDFEFFKYQKEFDALVLVGSKNEYLSLLPQIKIPLIFQNYGSLYICVDSNLNTKLKDILLDIDHFAFENDIELNYIDIENNIDILTQNLNYFGRDQVIAIFTTNTNTAYNFLNNLKCRKIFINSNPFKEDLLEFKEENFIFEKEIYFKN